MKLISKDTLILLVLLFLSNILIVNTISSQVNSVCPIGVGKEPKENQLTKSTSLVNEIFYASSVKWTNLQSIKYADGQKASIILSDLNRSRQIMGNNMRMQIPKGATINGIRLSVKGQSTNYKNIEELEVLLLGNDGEQKGQNKAKTVKLQLPWSVNSNGDDHMWMYGSKDDTWGTTWTADEINSENFGFQVQLGNIGLGNVEVLIDYIEVTVFYTPAYSFCDDNCLTFYIDKYETQGSYLWHVPEGFYMVSSLTSNQTIDLKVSSAQFGLHKICVDVFDQSGNLAEQCCRNFLYQDCTSSEIKGLVWRDLNDNQQRDKNEDILTNASIIIYSDAGMAVDTVLSNNLGVYHFADLPVAQYYIKGPAIPDHTFVLNNGGDPDFNSDITNSKGVGTTNLIKTEIGRCVEGIDLGYAPLVSIQGLVWEDKNYNGLYEQNEIAIPNQKVYLFSSANVLKDSAQTDSRGMYLFNKIVGNKYYLKFAMQGDFIPTFQNKASSGITSDINASGKSLATTYTEAGAIYTVDAGFYTLAKIGDFIWIDDNGDGIQNAEESGFSNVEVKLTGTSGDGNIVSLETKTDSKGKYYFSRINPGKYTINIVAPNGYQFTLTGQGENKTLDSDAISGQIYDIIVSSGDYNENYDAGLYLNASIGDFVWDDLNGNGIQETNEPGIPNVIVKLEEIIRDEKILIRTTTTDHSGNYIFDGVKPGHYNISIMTPTSYFSSTFSRGNDPNADSDAINSIISDIYLKSGAYDTSYDAGYYKAALLSSYVWEDLNGNGILDQGETGVPNITVTLTGISGSGEQIMITTTTNINGKYTFDNLMPGTYQLNFTIPNQYNFTSPNVGNDDTIDSDVINGKIENISLISGQTNTTLNAGLVKFVSIGDTVWEDMNGNGIFDIDEFGVANVNITLSGTTGNGQLISLSTTTDVNGKYTFLNLSPGMYNLTFSLPSGFVFTYDNIGQNDELDSDVVNGKIEGIELISGTLNNSFDAGAYRYGSIGDFIWEDTNANGIQGNGEKGLPNIGLTLIGNTGNGVSVSKTTTTNENGIYQFDLLPPGNYQINISVPDGYQVVQFLSSNDANKNSDAIGTIIPNINLKSGQLDTSKDAGLYKLGSIGDFVWHDKNVNGIQETDEAGIPNVKLNIKGITGFNTIYEGQAITDSQGKYVFNNIIPGTYEVNIELPEGFNLTTYKSGNDDTKDSDFLVTKIENIIILSGINLLNYDAGLFKLASAGDFVWLDDNFNGIQDVEDRGIQDVSVALSGIDGSGNQVNLNTKTDASGKYIFESLRPGSYKLQFSPSTALLPTLPLQGSDRRKDSDLTTSGINDIILMSGEERLDIDAGYISGTSVGDFVWEDLNANGIQDANEPGIAGVTLVLNGLTVDGQMISQTVISGMEGQYSFSGIFPGAYTIDISIPNGYTLTLVNAGSDDRFDSDIAEFTDKISFTLTNTTNNFDIDFGLVKFGSIGDLVYEDLNCNTSFDTNEKGLAGVEVTLSGLDFYSTLIQLNTTTNEDGHYLFENLRPGSYNINFMLPSGYNLSAAMISVVELKSGENILDFDAPVFRYASLGDRVWNDINENGIQDTGEPGLPNVELILRYVALNSQVEFKTTTNENGNYSFGDLKPTAYELMINIPANYKLTLPKAGNDTSVDSDANASGLVSDIILISGQVDLGKDIGLVSTSRASIGNFVWEDLNGNGLQDLDEPGIQGVKVILSEVLNDGSMVIGETITDFMGAYSFINLNAGSYFITFIKPDGYEFSTYKVGANMAIDSDANIISGATDIIMVTQADQITDIDAGVFRYAIIGDFVWNDLNKNGIQDISEPGLSGVILSLVDESNTIIQTVGSSSQGYYAFGNVRPDNYTIRATMPEGYAPTTMVSGDITLNSDFLSQNGLITTEGITIQSGAAIFDIDLGLIQTATTISGVAWIDQNGDGLRTDDEMRLAGVNVFLLNPAGDTLGTEMTTETGTYLFGNIDAGQYKIGFEKPDTLIFTISNQNINDGIDSDVLSPTIGLTGIFTIASGQEIMNVDAGYVVYSNIGDFVWLDENKDGLQGATEIGLNNIKVSLCNSDGTVIDSTLTGVHPVNGRSGYYQFGMVTYGKYIIKFGVLDNLEFTTINETDATKNSKVILSSTGSTALFDVLPGQSRDDIDAGYFIDALITGSIEGRVWMDGNNNKIRDNAEMSVSNVELKLYKSDGTLVDMTMTRADGTYIFENINFGDYYIQGPNIDGKVIVRYSGQIVPFDSDITNDFGAYTTRILTVFPGDALKDIDLGYSSVVSIGDFVWDDINYNGLQDAGEPGIGDVKISLINEFGIVEKTTVSSSTGQYSFTNIPVGSYVISVTRPVGYLTTVINNSDTNKNSKVGESGNTALTNFTLAQNYTNVDIGFVKAGQIGDNVWLDLNGNGFFQAGEPGIFGIKVKLYTSAGILVDSTSTKVGPNDFEGFYQFATVRPGSYYLKFEIPSNYIISPANIGDEDNDSNLTNMNGPLTTDVFVVAVGQTINNIDAAAYLPGTIGDKVWNDLNMNGIQESNEPGIPNISVSLFSQNGLTLATTITDQSGFYSFKGLRQRLYYLQFALPNGYQFSPQNSGNSGALDSDVDATGTTALISLAHGSTFLDLDAGMHVTNAKLVMGRMWNDVNEDGIRTEDEQLMPLVNVFLEDINKNVLATTVTNHAGMYCFATEFVGQHQVAVEAPVDHIFTEKNAGIDPLMDSDVSGEGFSDLLAFNDNYIMTYVDAGFYYKVTASLNGLVWEDKNNNSTRDASDDLLPNVLILLFSKNKIFVKSTKTDDSGSYSLKNLEPGSYYCLVPEFEDKSFIMFNGSNQDVDSEITNQYGLGTSRLITIAGGSPTANFDFGYKNKVSRFILPTENVLSEAIELYPNPSFWYVDISVRTNEKAAYYIINSIGAIVKEGVIDNGKGRIDTENLPSGRYAIVVNNAEIQVSKAFMKIDN